MEKWEIDAIILEETTKLLGILKRRLVVNEALPHLAGSMMATGIALMSLNGATEEEIKKKFFIALQADGKAHKVRKQRSH
jgi:Arc/MetJ family transcription regulator